MFKNDAQQMDPRAYLKVLPLKGYRQYAKAIAYLIKNAKLLKIDSITYVCIIHRHGQENYQM